MEPILNPPQEKSGQPLKLGFGRIPNDLYQLLPRWKKILLVLSLSLMLTGLILQMFDYLRHPNHRDVTISQSTPDHGLLTTRQLLPNAETPSDSSSLSLTSTSTEQNWYPAIFRMGFGFFAGFCVAYMIRMFFKFCAIAAGAVFLTLIGLQYADILDVDWIAIEQHYHTFTDWLTPQLSSFHRFITGFVPSSTMATLGGVIGLMKNRA